MPSKWDAKRDLKALYSAPRGRFVEVDVPSLSYFMVDGKGDPNRAASYREAVEALYTVSYTLKFLSKQELGRDYVVPPLEARWWAEDYAVFTGRDKEAWCWSAMILVPDFVPVSARSEAVERAAKKKALPALERLRCDTLHEGRCLQTLHIGPYDDEGPVLAELHEVIVPQRGLRLRGEHHEVYLSDPRRTAPERLRTLLRQPVEPS